VLVYAPISESPSDTSPGGEREGEGSRSRQFERGQDVDTHVEARAVRGFTGLESIARA
jgi:hypothetical protein